MCPFIIIIIIYFILFFFNGVCTNIFCTEKVTACYTGSDYRISQPIRCTVIFSLEILEKNNDECILILVIYWKKTGLLHTKISNHNIIYSS